MLFGGRDPSASGKKKKSPKKLSPPKQCMHAEKMKELLTNDLKNLATSSIQVKCSQCDNENATKQASSTLSICLHCGFQGCSQSTGSSHSFSHYLENEAHTLFFQIESKNISCLSCKLEFGEEMFKFTPGAKKLLQQFSMRVLEKIRNLKKGRGSRSEMDNWMDTSIAEYQQQSDVLPYRFTGLFNLKNTCYFNSLVQCLFRLKYVREELYAVYKIIDQRGLAFGSSKNSVGPITTELYKLFREMGSENCVCYNPGQMIKCLKKHMPLFGDYNIQQDTNEFFNFFLERLTDETEYLYKNISKEQNKKNKQGETFQIPTTPPWPNVLFHGTITNVVNCLECQYQSVTNELFHSLSLPITTDNLVLYMNEFLFGSENKKADCDSNKSKYEIPKAVFLEQHPPPSNISIDWKSILKHINFNPVEFSANLERLSTSVISILQQFPLTQESRDEVFMINQIERIQMEISEMLMEVQLKIFPFVEEVTGTDKLLGFSLDDCLMSYFTPEIVDENNKYECPKCSEKHGSKMLTTAVKMQHFLELPPILVVHLKRFKITLDGASKVKRPLHFPYEIDLEKYCKLKDDAARKNSYRFQLCGSIHHTGNICKGHYTNYVVGATNDEWICFNDDSKFKSTFSEADRESVYMLFYVHSQSGWKSSDNTSSTEN